MIRIEPIKHFICQKVLPVTYDNSLSYYEVLCKFVHSLNDVISNINGLVADYEALYNFVINYFDNLDIEEEVQKQIEEMLDSPEFAQYLLSIIGFVTPTMFGAKGDGETDDSQAFVDCFATGYPVRIFRGHYKVLTDIISVDKQEVMCDWDAYIDTVEPIAMYDGKWKGGCVTSEKTGFVLWRGECRIQDTRIHVSGATANGVSCHGGYSLLDDLLIDGHETAYMGVWSDHDGDVSANMNILRVHNCTIRNFRLNAIFTSAVSSDIAYCTLSNNHIQTDPQGGGQIDIVGKVTQGYATVRNNVISLVGNYATSGIELEKSGNADIFGNVINMTDSLMYGVVLQNASHANVHDNSIIGGGVGIACITKGRNILRTSNNWMQGCTYNVEIEDDSTWETQLHPIVSLDEERFTGSLIRYIGNSMPIVDVNNHYMWEGTVAPNALLSFRCDHAVHSLRYIIDGVLSDVFIDDVNNILITDNVSITYGTYYLTYTNGTGADVNVKVLVLN